MQEVTVRIRFNQPCLGHVRRRDRNEMLRNADNQVMFLPTWWAAIVGHAAQILNAHQELVKKIDFDPVVDGATSLYKRYFAPRQFTVHEAFLPGDVVAIHCVLPDGLPANDFRELMDVAGRYRGVCPYKPERRQGTFEVIDVSPKLRHLSNGEGVELSRPSS